MNPEPISAPPNEAAPTRLRVGGADRRTPPRPSTAPLELEGFVGPEVVREFLAFDSIETIYRLCRSGMPHRRIGRNLRFRLSEIEDWLTSEGITNERPNEDWEFGADGPSLARSQWLT